MCSANPPCSHTTESLRDSSVLCSVLTNFKDLSVDLQQAVASFNGGFESVVASEGDCAATGLAIVCV